MFDGLKFKTDFVDLRQLEGLPIEPEMLVGMRTGELRKITGEHNGIHIETANQAGAITCRARGSLQRYANGGAANVGAFPFGSVCGAVAGLCEQFGIEPQNARLENLEFGLDLFLPVDARQFVRSLICHGDKPFQPINTERPDLGKVAIRQKYEFKIYDKGRQADTGENNLVRLEVKVCKMMFLQAYGIATLLDLTDRDKVRALGEVLKGLLEGVICYDGSVPETALAVREQLRLKDFGNPIWWADLDKRSRWHYRQKFDAWAVRHGANRVFVSVVETVVSEWKKLLCEAQQTLDFLPGQKPNGARRKLDFLPRMMRGSKVQLTVNKYKSLDEEKKGPTDLLSDPSADALPSVVFSPSKCCLCCGRDISAQKRNSRYCSEARLGPAARRCRDKAYRHRQREARRMEAAHLDALLLDLPGAVAALSVFALDPAATDRRLLRAVVVAAPLHALAGQPFVGIRQAVRVEVIGADGQCHAFTRSRAKHLLKFISSLKISGNESVTTTSTATGRATNPSPVLHPRNPRKAVNRPSAHPAA